MLKIKSQHHIQDIGINVVKIQNIHDHKDPSYCFLMGTYFSPAPTGHS